MPRCTRKGCNKEYDPAANSASSCTYHPGAPVFHEGLKSWSCCSDVNKPALEFDEFMKIPGCTVCSHTDEAPQVPVPAPATKTSSTGASLTMKEAKDGVEIYSSGAPKVASPKPSIPLPMEAPVVEDDLSVPVTPGTICKRKGCGTAFVSDEVNRIGDGDETICTYHPAAPMFHEGSKGYLCCKRRVLEFDEFLKIEGCKRGRHVFAPKQRTESQAEQFTDCRVDHYQTPKEVHISVFAKQADKEKSTVAIEENQIHVDLYLPGSKRFRRTIILFGPVDPDGSSYKFYNTKVEVVLKKLDTRSWTLLEETTRDLGNISLTFGVGGRTGTIGGKDLVLDEQNATKIN
ncbi:chord-domain-containing protein [Suillus paluster]|uniref:chord-domain-containing protein n=1 Tax=Suillus paluster TaxID=48578 RepID=UPI001B866D98|nr:chord-domain-containing protein [Suillus paluster]KAG1748980.1 chord-domain-containing protein [Suillus paluster]